MMKKSKIYLILVLVLISASCTTVRNAERRHDRIVRNFPLIHSADTVEVQTTVVVEVPGASGTDTLYFTTNSIDTIRDTIFFPNDIRVVHTIWRDKAGNNTLKTDLFQPDRKIETVINQKVPVIYQNRPLKFWQKWWGIGIICIVAFINGWAISEINKKRYDNK
jgi:hypothetical protein